MFHSWLVSLTCFWHGGDPRAAPRPHGGSSERACCSISGLLLASNHAMMMRGQGLIIIPFLINPRSPPPDHDTHAYKEQRTANNRSNFLSPAQEGCYLRLQDGYSLRVQVFRPMRQPTDHIDGQTDARVPQLHHSLLRGVPPSANHLIWLIRPRPLQRLLSALARSCGDSLRISSSTSFQSRTTVISGCILLRM